VIYKYKFGKRMVKAGNIQQIINHMVFSHQSTLVIFVNHISIKNVHIIIEVIFKALTQDFIIYKQVSSTMEASS